MRNSHKVSENFHSTPLPQSRWWENFSFSSATEPMWWFLYTIPRSLIHISSHLLMFSCMSWDQSWPCQSVLLLVRPPLPSLAFFAIFSVSLPRRCKIKEVVLHDDTSSIHSTTSSWPSHPPAPKVLIKGRWLVVELLNWVLWRLQCRGCWWLVLGYQYPWPAEMTEYTGLSELPQTSLVFSSSLNASGSQ